MGFRDDSQSPAAVDDDSAVAQSVPDQHGCADHDHWAQLGGAADDSGDGIGHGVEQGVGQQQVVNGIAADPQFRVDRHGDAAGVGCAGNLQCALGVGCGVEVRHGQGHRRDAREALLVEVVEVHGAIAYCQQGISPSSKLWMSGGGALVKNHSF